MPRLCTLLIDYGDFPSLVAATILSRPDEAVILHPRGHGAGAAGREAAALRHGEVLDVGEFLVDGIQEINAGSVGGGSMADPHRIEALDDACVLMRAAAAADRLGCSKILWPRQVGPDADRIGQVVQRASLVADVVQVGADGASTRRLVIDLPLVDLTDQRLVDLADEGGAPMRAFQPCSADGGSTAIPCERCDGCRRWRAAFDAAGVAWPWMTVEGRADAA
jgi:hypothetical protein